jgi:hypothetical protein
MSRLRKEQKHRLEIQRKKRKKVPMENENQEPIRKKVGITKEFTIYMTRDSMASFSKIFGWETILRVRKKEEVINKYLHIHLEIRPKEENPSCNTPDP